MRLMRPCRADRLGCGTRMRTRLWYGLGRLAAGAFLRDQLAAPTGRLVRWSADLPNPEKKGREGADTERAACRGDAAVAHYCAACGGWCVVRVCVCVCASVQAAGVSALELRLGRDEDWGMGHDGGNDVGPSALPPN